MCHLLSTRLCFLQTMTGVGAFRHGSSSSSESRASRKALLSATTLAINSSDLSSPSWKDRTYLRLCRNTSTASTFRKWRTCCQQHIPDLVRYDNVVVQGVQIDTFQYDTKARAENQEEKLLLSPARTFHITRQNLVKTVPDISSLIELKTRDNFYFLFLFAQVTLLLPIDEDSLTLINLIVTFMTSDMCLKRKRQ
jgi:hypothetical protein